MGGWGLELEGLGPDPAILPEGDLGRGDFDDDVEVEEVLAAALRREDERAAVPGGIGDSCDEEIPAPEPGILQGIGEERSFELIQILDSLFHEDLFSAQCAFKVTLKYITNTRFCQYCF